MPELQEKAVNYSAANVTITTTTETAVVSSGRVPTPRHTCLVLVKAWCVLTNGTGTTAVTARIRRGTNTSGTLVSEANAEQIKTAAGSTEPYTVMATEERAGQESVEYTLTIQQTAATANGTVVAAAIEVEILGG
jgi:hypothetical protein